nr:DNA phosphorothioation system sulfurtransferase DndC [Azospirillum sp. 412522]
MPLLPDAFEQDQPDASLWNAVRDELREAFRQDDRPWVVAFSGGKDSTAVLQLVYDMVLELGPAARKPVHVVSSDTMVEAPNVAAYVERVLQAIQTDADARGLKLTTHLVRPEINETFWAKLIGLGYPSPTRWFRWCTTNMKIKPSRRLIDGLTAEHGSVILLLGSRRAESSGRRTRMDGRRRNARQLNPHHEIPNAFVLNPIADWSNDEVWTYLYESNPPPWGFRHDEMLNLYRQAVGGECPVVVDLNTPSCGGSRFGCWTCTVVKADKSMNGFIETGDEWMRPLARFRDELKTMREDLSLREEKRRDGSDGPGAFKPHARRQLLEKLLQAERDVGLQLIRDKDIGYIQRLWSAEFDLADSALNLARTFGRIVEGEVPALPLDESEQALLKDLAAQHELNEDLITKILSLEPEFPNLDAWGVKPDLRKRLGEIIESAVRAEGAVE